MMTREDDGEDSLANYRLSPELIQREREEYFANRFRRAAHYHDWRIPFEVRVAVLTRANGRCESCKRFCLSSVELHHIAYKRAYGNELPGDLAALCRECHEAQPRW